MELEILLLRSYRADDIESALSTGIGESVSPVLFTGASESVTVSPVLFTGASESVTVSPVLFTGASESVTVSPVLFTGASESSSCSSVDAYEAGRAELVRLPQSQLHTMLTLLLDKDNVDLTVQPYTAQVN